MSTSDELKTEPKKGGLLASLKGAITPSGITTPQIAEKLKAAESELGSLHAQHPTLALDAMTGDAGSVKALADLQAKVTATSITVATLKAALRASEGKDHKEVMKRRESFRQAQIAQVKKHLDARTDAAVALSASISESAKHWKLMLEHGRMARSVSPEVWPSQDDYESVGGLRKAVQHQIHKLGADPQMKTSLPGGQCSTLDFLQNPAGERDLVDLLKKNSASVLAALTGKIG